MGVVVCPNINDYWEGVTRQPIMDAMGLQRFMQIKRYLRVSSPSPLQNPHWTAKLEPVASVLASRFRALYVPSTNLAIDEMMVQFSGRGAHTLKMPNKPIGEGYKIFALCDHGYTYTFEFYSRIDGARPTTIATSAATSDQPTSAATSNQPIKLTPTSQTCLRLAKVLPYMTYRFNIYFDNYFSNVALFAILRELGISACGTARSSTIPEPLRIDNNTARKVLPWDHTSAVIESGVLCGLWQDNNTVFVMSTIHDLNTRTLVHRRRPRETSTNAASARKIFASDVRKLLLIPSLIDDYNQYMGGVDIADQLRSYYTTHLRGRRNWLPLFYWLLDTTPVNSYIFYRFFEPSITHKAFQLRVCTMLIQEGTQERIRNCSQLHVHYLQPIDQSNRSRRGCKTCKARTMYKCFKCDNSFCFLCI